MTTFLISTISKIYDRDNLVVDEIYKKFQELGLGRRDAFTRYLKKKSLTLNICERLFEKTIDLFEYIPNQFKTREMSNRAVEADPRCLRYVPDNLKTANMCNRAVEADPRCLRYVPDNLKTANMCNRAVGADPQYLRYVPDNLKTANMCSKAVEKSPRWCLEFVPDHLMTKDMCSKAVNEWAHCLQDVPDHLKTQEMCENAVRSKDNFGGYSPWYSDCFKAIPKEFLTCEICEIAVTRNPYNIMYVPEDLKTQSMCDNAVKEYKGYNRYVPYHLKNVNLISKDELKLEYKCYCSRIEDMMERCEYYQKIINEYFNRYDDPTNDKDIKDEIRKLKIKRDKLLRKVRDDLDDGFGEFNKFIYKDRNIPRNREGKPYKEASDWEYNSLSDSDSD